MLQMRHPFYVIASTVLFLIIGTLHAVRAFYEWNITVTTHLGVVDIPVWLSWVVVLTVFLLAIGGLYHLR